MNKFKVGDKVVCVEERYTFDDLTLYKTYVIIKIISDFSIAILDNNDDLFSYSANRFISLNEFRLLKLKKLI